MKKRIFILLNQNRFIIEFIYMLIILNVIALMLESFVSIQEQYGVYLHYFEIFSVVVFTIEYFLRIWTADCDELIKGNSFVKRIKFIFSTYGLIDLIAILPFYLPMFLALDMRIIRILRLMRLLRIFKLGRYSKSMKLIGSVLKETRSDLTVTMFTCLILIIFSSTLMYYIEHAAQPDKFRNVGYSIWWSVATVTTVGYGDIYPITPLGKLLGAFTALIGIGFVALPTGIISSAFVARASKKHLKAKTKCVCPKCGHHFHM